MTDHNQMFINFQPEAMDLHGKREYLCGDNKMMHELRVTID